MKLTRPRPGGRRRASSIATGSVLSPKTNLLSLKLLPTPNRSPTMPDLQDGESTHMQGSGAKPYVLKNTGGVYSCSCPAWRNQSTAIERRTCKHLRKLRGDDAEETRIGGALPQKPVKASVDGDEEGP